MSSEQVWLAMRKQLAGFFRRRVADEHTVEDLVSETFLRVHAALDSVQDEDRIDAWVWRIARGVLVDHRRRARSEELESPEGVEQQDGEAANFNAEVNSWLAEYLAKQLPEEQREAVELSDVQGLTQPAIAQRLGLSLTATKSRVQRGRQRLRELVASCCHLEFDSHENVVGYRRRSSGTCCGGAAGESASC